MDGLAAHGNSTRRDRCRVLATRLTCGAADEEVTCGFPARGTSSQEEVNPVLLVPWDPSLGAPSGPAELPGFGLVDEQDTMALLAAAARHPATRWCLSVVGPGGDTAAHGCAPGRCTLADITSPDAETAAGLAARLGITLTPFTTGTCQHAHAEPGYTPSRPLRHLVQARTTRCAAPSCPRPAAACDLDHTIAWEDSQLTCECNLAPPVPQPSPDQASPRVETRTTGARGPSLGAVPAA